MREDKQRDEARQAADAGAPATGQHRIEPQRRLMAAVLQTVLDDVRGPSRRAAGRHAHEQARAYVASKDRSWPFSFENVCEAIGIDADRMREQLTVPGRPARGSSDAMTALRARARAVGSPPSLHSR